MFVVAGDTVSEAMLKMIGAAGGVVSTVGFGVGVGVGVGATYV